MRLEQERARVALAGALEIETMEPDRDGRRRPDAPWCSPRQETSAFLRRQLGDTFQVQVDAGLERRDDRRERLAVYGDVEIKADGVPLLAASVGITPQSGHVDSASPRLSGRRSGGVAPVLPAVDAPFESGESIAEVPHVGAEVPHVGAQPREQGDQQAGREPRLEPVGHVRKLSQRACAVKRRPGPPPAPSKKPTPEGTAPEMARAAAAFRRRYFSCPAAAASSSARAPRRTLAML